MEEEQGMEQGDTDCSSSILPTTSTTMETVYSSPISSPRSSPRTPSSGHSSRPGTSELLGGSSPLQQGDVQEGSMEDSDGGRCDIHSNLIQSSDRDPDTGTHPVGRQVHVMEDEELILTPKILCAGCRTQFSSGRKLMEHLETCRVGQKQLEPERSLTPLTPLEQERQDMDQGGRSSSPDYRPTTDIEDCGVTREEIRGLNLTTTPEQEEKYIRAIWKEHQCRTPIPQEFGAFYYRWVQMGAEEDALLDIRRALVYIIRKVSPDREILLKVLENGVSDTIGSNLVTYMYLVTMLKEPGEG